MTDERLKQAARQAGQAIADSLPAPEDCTHTFSLHSQQKMTRLLRRAERPRRRPALRAACMLLVCLLGCGVFFQVNAEAKEIFLGWVSQQADTVQQYFFSGISQVEKTGGQYTISKIPDGYQEYDIYVSPNNAEMIYLNVEENHFFTFGYLLGDTESDSSRISFVTAGMKRQATYVNGASAEFFFSETGDTGNLLIWLDTARESLLYLDGYFSKKELVSFAESVQYQF